MKVQVTINNVKIIEPSILNENEYNIHECEFEFVEEYNGLSKKAIFTNEAGADYIVSIVNDKCSIPSEVLKEKEFVKLGVYAYDVENEELVLRYSPKPTEFYVQEGSYKNAGGTPPTPSEIEQLQAQITHNRNDIEEIQDNINDINEQQAIQDETIQNNTNAIGIINETIGTINENIGDLQEEQVEQNRNIQANADNIEEIQQEQITQNTNIQKNTDDIVEINQNINEIDGHINAINEDIDNLEQDLTNYSLITETGSQINLNVNSTNYKITAVLKDKNGNVIYTSNAIDLPIESMIVNARYDNATKEIVLTLQNGNTLRISVADLVSGLVSETQLQTILANYYTKTEVDNLLSEKANQTSLDTTNQNLTNLAGRVSTNEEDIADIKEEQTTQNTNIEELQNQVETLQTDLESANAEIEELNTDITNMRKAMLQVEGQGTDITLQNTSENKFVEFSLEGRTEQEQLTGKNLFDKDNANILNTAIDANGLGNNTPSSYRTVYIPCKPNTTYTISKLYDSSKNRFTVAYTNVLPDYNIQTYGNIYNNNASNVTITTGADAKYIVAYVWISGGDTTVKEMIDSIQIEQGSTATSYEPYCGGIPSPNPDFTQQIKNVTGQANVKIQNENLAWNGWAEDFVNRIGVATKADIRTKDGRNCLRYDSSAGYQDYDNKYLFKIPFKENTQYTFVCDLFTEHNRGNIAIEYTDGTSSMPSLMTKNVWNKFIFTSSNNKTIKYLEPAYYSGGTYIDLDTFMVLEGSYTIETIPSYVPHKEQNYPFTFAEGQRGMQGTQLLDDGIHQKRKQIVLTGEENWGLSGITTNNQYYLDINDIKTIGSGTTTSNLLCNYLKYIPGYTGYNNNNVNGISGWDSQQIRISLDISIVNRNVPEFKQWLATKYANGTPVIVEYELSEEAQKTEIIPYNATQQSQYNNIKANASSYDDITYITSTSDELGFDMNVVAVADANKVIDSELQEIKSAVIALGGDINV